MLSRAILAQTQFCLHHLLFVKSSHPTCNTSNQQLQLTGRCWAFIVSLQMSAWAFNLLGKKKKCKGLLLNYRIESWSQKAFMFANDTSLKFSFCSILDQFESQAYNIQINTIRISMEWLPPPQEPYSSILSTNDHPLYVYFSTQRHN